MSTLFDLGFREDGTIESAVPLPAPFAGGSSGASPFTPGQFIDATPPEWPRSLVKVSPRPRNVPGLPDQLFPGSPDTIDLFFH